MLHSGRRVAVVTVLALLGFGAVPASAQEYQQVISANPFGLLLEIFNAEFERAVTESTTAGIGGSTSPYDDFNDVEQTYFNADVFWRYYVSGRHFDGWNFGVKAGVTSLESGTYPGFGFDANRSWLLGKNRNFYVGLGFGLKRLVGDLPEDDLEIIPTFRVVNVGIAF